MELDKKRFSIRRHITLVLTLLTVLIVLLIGVCVAVVREQSRIRLTSAADSYLSLLTRTLENQLVIQESYITSQVLNSEELHRLGFGEGHTQAYLDSYKLHTGFSSAMAAGNDVTALYLYSELHFDERVRHRPGWPPHRDPDPENQPGRDPAQHGGCQNVE